MKNIHIEKTMLELKKYCQQFEDCEEGCELYDGYECYLERCPEEYFKEGDEYGK